MSYCIETIAYQRIRIVCDGCGASARQGRYGWSKSVVAAEDRAKSAGWSLGSFGGIADVGSHLCPVCKPTPRTAPIRPRRKT